MTHEELERSALWNSLVHLGMFVKTKWKFNPGVVEKQLEQFEMVKERRRINIEKKVEQKKNLIYQLFR